jgi:deoxyribonuclease V
MQPSVWTWPASAEGLADAQQALAKATPLPWAPPSGPLLVGGCFVCFARGIVGPGDAGDLAVAAAVLMGGRRELARAVVCGRADAPYRPGLLALREGPLLAAAVRALITKTSTVGVRGGPAVILVNASGRDHPRRAGLATQLGAVLDLPTVGVTNRPLLATGDWPADVAGATAPLRLDGDGAGGLVGYWLRTRQGSKPLVVHAAWRTDPQTAVQVVRAATWRVRTPEVLRRARTAARGRRQ